MHLSLENPIRNKTDASYSIKLWFHSSYILVIIKWKVDISLFKQLLEIFHSLKSRFQFEINSNRLFSEMDHFINVLKQFELLAQFRFYCERVIYKFLYEISNNLNQNQKYLLKKLFKKFAKIDCMMFIESLSFKDSDIFNIIFASMVGILLSLITLFRNSEK